MYGCVHISYATNEDLMIRIALRDSDGKTQLFRVEPQDAATHEEALILAREHYPDALVILASVRSS